MERRCVLNSWSKEEVRAVIRYEWARGESGTEIHNRLVEVYGPGVMSKQMVRRWCRTISDGRQQVEDILKAGRTRTATTDANVGKVDDMIRANRRITIDEVAEELGISHERAQNIIHDILRYRKVSARWVPRQLTSTHQEQRMAVSLEHLLCTPAKLSKQNYDPQEKSMANDFTEKVNTSFPVEAIIILNALKNFICLIDGLLRIYLKKQGLKKNC
ncbi:histone-lysine N-methyltransferase SETMAR [Trichonephila clavata]|uniref:Histone-lysine N-methyltransferase SETMAR n=1 Tax=Trichonephila clavata TaxID=2740835 RepID=A0A8X6LYY0_TRICU|nr:histone-lysine N-methyltransferase SETMAR [Trichonephila clavata]